jgi:hypothetical protein
LPCWQSYFLLFTSCIFERFLLLQFQFQQTFQLV